MNANNTKLADIQQKTGKIKLSEKIAYGFGDMSSSMFWKLFGVYLMIFYTDVYGLSAAVVGTMFLVTRIWDSAFDPIIGILADRTNTKHGKFRPYLKYLALPFGIAGVLTFSTPNFNDTWKIIYAYGTYTLMMMVYSAINVPYASLLGVISNNPKERNILATFRMTFAYLGSFIALLMFMPIVNLFKGSSTDLLIEQKSWQYAVMVIASVCVILFLLCYSLTKERVKPVNEKKTPLSQDIKDLLHNKPWWILLVAGISALVFNSIRDGATVYYFKYYIVEKGYKSISIFGIPFILSGLYLAVGQASNIIGVIIAAPLSNKYGKKAIYMWSMIIACILSIAFYWLGKDNLALIFILQALISICAGSIFPLLWSMYADCADYSELKTGNRATGLIFSSSSMSQKFGWAIGTALTGWLLAAFGFKANTIQSSETINGIKMFLSFLPAVGTLISAICISLYPLSENKMEKINLKLEQRRINEKTI
ncbi:MAG: MFS transporter [Bacteroidales bacterium]